MPQNNLTMIHKGITICHNSSSPFGDLVVGQENIVR
jgi:hypothetical protein